MIESDWTAAVPAGRAEPERWRERPTPVADHLVRPRSFEWPRDRLASPADPHRVAVLAMDTASMASTCPYVIWTLHD